MIYITGDMHAEFDRIMYLAEKMNKDDILIVAGDFGIWNNSPREQYYFKNISKLDITVLFVDGNHENFDMLNSFEIKEWNGGKIHEIKPNIIHLMRGQIYNINNCSILTFGGAKSHDIQDGILDPKDPDFKIKKRRLVSRRDDIVTGMGAYAVESVAVFPIVPQAPGRTPTDPTGGFVDVVHNQPTFRNICVPTIFRAVLIKEVLSLRVRESPVNRVGIDGGDGIDSRLIEFQIVRIRHPSEVFPLLET